MKTSAGLLLYRIINNQLEVFLVHPGGPFWKNKDTAAWSIPKGELNANEDPLKAAIREFKEETGQDIHGNFIPLSGIKQSSGKTVYAWAIQGDDIEENKIISNTIEIQWPPKSGKTLKIPEIDMGKWFSLEIAEQKIVKGQREFLFQLKTISKSW